MVCNLWPLEYELTDKERGKGTNVKCPVCFASIDWHARKLKEGRGEFKLPSLSCLFAWENFMQQSLEDQGDGCERRSNREFAARTKLSLHFAWLQRPGASGCLQDSRSRGLRRRQFSQSILMKGVRRRGVGMLRKGKWKRHNKDTKTNCETKNKWQILAD